MPFFVLNQVVETRESMNDSIAIIREGAYEEKQLMNI